MKLVSFASLKGGAGKTTGLMAATSGLQRLGLRVALFEADKNDPLKFWRYNAIENGTWSDDCQIFDAAGPKELEAAYARAQRAGYDVALLDAEGGESELNTTAIVSSDLILVPVSLSALDIEYGIQSFQFARQVLKDNELDVEIAFLICRFPSAKDKLTRAEQESLEILSRLPQMSTRMPLRAAYADLSVSGMIHLYYAGLVKDPALRVTSFSILTALREADALATDILHVLAMELPHANP